MRQLSMIALGVALATGFVHAQQATPSADAPPLTRELIAKGITPPELLNKVEAEFSDEARSKHINGACFISLIVDAMGNPQNLRIIHCTDSSFEESSLDAVAKYRFRPATTQEGKPVPVKLSVEINYHLYSFPIERKSSKTQIDHEISKPIRYSFLPQRGGPSNPDSSGVYPLTRSVTGPRVIKFPDEGYGRIAFVHEGNSTCEIVLTISVKGKASDPQVTHCERPELEEPAVESLLKSEYTPGKVNGEAVPMRASLHLEYGGDSPQ
jgi:hypothetical protein